MPLITTYFRAKVDDQTISDDIVLGLHVKENGIKLMHLNDEVLVLLLSLL